MLIIVNICEFVIISKIYCLFIDGLMWFVNYSVKLLNKV